MIPLLILISSFSITLTIQKLFLKKLHINIAGRIALSIMLIYTSIGHFIFIDGICKMIPSFIFYKNEIVILTGFFEIILAIGLLFKKLKTIVGYTLIIFLVVITPCNIKASLENLNIQTGNFNGKGINYLFIRIPAQLFFIGWSYFFTIKNASK
ncbi:DoxX family protein [Tenacibaculum sp. nBUS_03]|uniref:DoxX family protein n=1 Tax=Tenacibaculum sp. nBUS_03 TaxID=3395320 RepID=UPI003EB90DE7